jgi:hypothetical protein
MSTEKKALIKTLFDENVTQHKIHNAICADIETVLTDEFCYISELLQNANDAGAADFTMRYIDGYLIYTNSGNPFDPTQIRRICGYSDSKIEVTTEGMPQEDKLDNINKIGHKDVGFKSVFKFSNCVYIRSNDYSFRFDGSHDWAQLSSHQVPWMITPLWTEHHEFPPIVQPYLKQGKTQFIFKVKLDQREQVLKNLQSIRNNLEVLLFLDRIKNVRIYISFENKVESIAIKREEGNSQVRIHEVNNSKNDHYWFVKKYKNNLPDDVKRALKAMSSFSCPDKVKALTEVEISFAIMYDSNKKIVDIKRKSRLFTHLPTTLRCELPFNVNAVFLLDKSRQTLLKNNYNAFLFKCIGSLQFQFAEYLSKLKSFKGQVLSVIGFDFQCQDQDFYHPYREGLNSAAQVVKFLMPYNVGEEMISLGDAVVDHTCVIYSFKLKNVQIPNLISGAVNNAMLIIQHKFGRKSEPKKICEILHNNIGELVSNATTYVRLLQHMVQHSPNFLDAATGNNLLKEFAVFLCTDNLLRSAVGVFIPDNAELELDEKHSEHFTKIKLPQFKIEIMSSLPKSEKVKLYNWLKSLGMIPSSHDYVIEKYLSVNLQNLVYQPQANFFVVSYLYLAFCEGCNLEKFKVLQGIPLLTTTEKMRPANQLLFSREFNVDNGFQSEVKFDIFLSSIYLSLDKESPEKIRRFFKSLGVVSSIELRQVNIKLAELKVKYPNEYEGYKNYLKNDIIRLPHDDNDLVLFTHVDFMQLFGNQAYQDIFFKIFTDKWPAIKQADDRCFLNMGTKKNLKIPSFIYYYLSNHAKVITRQNTQVPLKSTYDPSYGIFDTDLLPTIRLAKPLTTEQIDYLGLKRIIHVNIVIKLLQQWAKLKLDDTAVEKYCLLYRVLLSQDYPASFSERLKSASICLPASDQTFQPLELLSCYDVNPDEAPFSKLWLKHLPGVSREQMRQLSNLLGLQIVKDFDIRMDNKEVDKDFRRELENKLPLFALYLHSKTFSSPGRYLDNWAEVFSKLTTYYADKIYDINDPGQSIPVHYNPLTYELVYHDRWKKSDVLRLLCKRLGENVLNLDTNCCEMLSDILKLKTDQVNGWAQARKINHQDVVELTNVWQQRLDQFRLALDQEKVEAVEDDAELLDRSASEKNLKKRSRNEVESELPLQENNDGQIQESIQRAFASLDPEAMPLSLPEDVVNNEESPLKQAHFDEEPPQTLLSPETPDLSMKKRSGDLQRDLLLRSSGGTVCSSSAKRSLYSSDDDNANKTTKKKAVAKAPKPKIEHKEFAPTISFDALLNFNAPFAGVLNVSKVQSGQLGQNPAPSPAVLRGNMAGLKAMKDSEVDEKTRNAIGLHGEAISYRYLRDHYVTKYSQKSEDGTEKHPGLVITDTDQGFQLSTPELPALLTVLWCDKQFALGAVKEKSALPYDIQVVKPHKINFIEVKATRTSKSRQFTISGAEIDLMNSQKDRYCFFRVLAVESEQPSIEIIKNPAKLFEEDKIQLKVKSVEVSYAPEAMNNP